MFIVGGLSRKLIATVAHGNHVSTYGCGGIDREAIKLLKNSTAVRPDTRAYAGYVFVVSGVFLPSLNSINPVAPTAIPITIRATPVAVVSWTTP